MFSLGSSCGMGGEKKTESPHDTPKTTGEKREENKQGD